MSATTPDEPSPATPPRGTHEPRPARRGRPLLRTALALLLGGGLFVLDSALLAGFCRTGDAVAPLLAHVGLVAVTASAGFGAGWVPRTARLQLAAWMALLGPFGLLVGFTLFLPRSGMIPGIESADRAGPERLDAPARLDMLREGLADGRLRLAGGHSVRPLLDLMIEGSNAEKLEALGLVAKHYVPDLAPSLRRALQDTDGSVRVLAATVMAKLRDGHTRRIGLLQEAAAATTEGEAWRALGTARLAYAASGLLEPDRAAGEAAEGRACLIRAAGTGGGQLPETVIPTLAASCGVTADCLG